MFGTKHCHLSRQASVVCSKAPPRSLGRKYIREQEVYCGGPLCQACLLLFAGASYLHA